MRNARLERAASRVLNSKGTAIGVEVTFMAGDQIVKGRDVLELHTSADFLNKFTSDIDITTMVALVDYRYKIYPHRDNLKAIVQIFPLDVTGDVYLSPSPLFSDTYRALLYDNDDGSMASSSPITSAPDAGSLDEERMIRVQLVEPAAEALSYKNAQGNFRSTDNGNILAGFLAEMIRQEVQDNPDAALKIQMEPIDSVVDTRDAVTIPISKRIIDVPEYLQTKQGGLYSNGLISFIRSGTWWIGPAFDTTRYLKTTRRLNLIQLNGINAPVADKSWLFENEQLTVVCTTSCKMQDISVGMGINQGQGVRFIKASGMFNKGSSGEPNKENFNREDVMAEFQVGERQDGNNIAMMSDTPITDNIAHEYSKIAFRKGQLFITIWQRSLARLVYPGMPLRLFYDKDGQTQVYDGVLVQIDEQLASEAQGMIMKNMIGTAALVCYINKEPTVNG